MPSFHRGAVDSWTLCSVLWHWLSQTRVCQVNEATELFGGGIAPLRVPSPRTLRQREVSLELCPGHPKDAKLPSGAAWNTGISTRGHRMRGGLEWSPSPFSPVSLLTTVGRTVAGVPACHPSTVTPPGHPSLPLPTPGLPNHLSPPSKEKAVSRLALTHRHPSVTSFLTQNPTKSISVFI